MNTTAPQIRTPGQSGFSFIEVMIALGILLVGSVSIISLFSIGVWHQTERRLEARVLQVTPEIVTIVTEEVDNAAPGRMPSAIKGRSLSIPGYTVDVKWTAKSFVEDSASASGVFAHSVLKFRGQPVRTLMPIPLTRSTLDPRQGAEDAK